MTMKHPVMVMTDDNAVLHCLRALAFYSETNKKNAVVAGVTHGKWQANGNVVTFRFSDAKSRDLFLFEVDRILPEGSYVIEVAKDSESAAA